MKKILFQLFIVSFFGLATSQVTVVNMPRKMALYPRLAPADTGCATISGSIDSTGSKYTSMRIKAYRNNALVTTQSQTLIFTGKIAPFSFNYGIKAELAMYKFELLGVAGSVETLIKSADSIVCGDVFIVQGQSNAEAHAFEGSSTATLVSPYIRVFGSADPNQAVFDSVWHIGQGDDGQSSAGNTGEWEQRMARSIVDNQKFPVAIFNGCYSGKPIDTFQRNDANPASANTNYGHLLRRLLSTGLNKWVQAILWVQGESDADAGTSTAAYKASFAGLRADWLSDYSSVKKIYLFQIRNGCSYSLVNASQITEAHRQLAEELPNTAIMSMSAQQHDTATKCHYRYINGYELMGNNIYRLVARDFYGVNADNIEAPDIKFAEISGPNEITLIMKNIMDNLTWYNGSQAEFLISGTSATVTAGATQGNRIKLTLSGSPTGATTISFMGHSAIPPEPMALNGNGVGAVHFYLFPFTTARYRDSISVAAILKSNSVALPVNSVVVYSGGRIVTLDLSNRGVSVLPADIGYMDGLTSINLSGNALTTLPRAITKLSPSVSLNIDKNQLCGISDTLITSWITRYSKDAAWATTQMLDTAHYCNGTTALHDAQPAIFTGQTITHALVHDHLVVNFPASLVVRQVRIFKVNGSLTFRSTNVSKALSIDVSGYCKGLYIMQVSTPGGVMTNKIVLQ